MDDTKLLELAGRAAGEKYDVENNPLERDDLALRLAVKLGLTINPYKRGVFVSRDEDEPVIREEWGDDDASTTRRAITHAAAEIARAADAGGKEG